MDKLIEGIRGLTDIPIVVLTNGSLLSSETVQQELLEADLVIPSLDAGDDATFQLVNRPHEDVSFERMLSGLVSFRRRFPKQYWLEVFLLGGYTTSQRELDAIRRCVDRLQPDRVQLNTVSRPPRREHGGCGFPGRVGGDCRDIFLRPPRSSRNFTTITNRKLVQLAGKRFSNCFVVVPVRSTTWLAACKCTAMKC